MRHLRVLLACCLAALALAACAGDGDDEQQDAITIVEEVDGVASARAVTWSDDPESTYLRIVLEDGLSEQQVRDAVDDLKTGFDPAGAPDAGSLQVVFDEFSAGVYPRHSGIENPDPDLERALWLREDGRATWFGPGPHFRPGQRLSRSGTSPLAIVPAADVLEVALDLEAEVPTDNEVRRSYAVGSPDGALRVHWSNYPGTLDRAGLEALRAVQEQYPGTTGYFDNDPRAIAVHLDDDDLSLPRALAVGPGLIDRFLVSEVGWGPLRAETFTELGRRARELGPALARLRALDGVRAVTSDGVQVDDLATLDVVRRLLPDETVQLVREPNDLLGFAPDPVLEVGSYTDPALVPLWRQVSRLDGVRQINPALVLETDIPDADLRRLFALLRPRVGPGVRMPITVGEAPIYRIGDGAVLGELDGGGGFTPAATLLPPATDDLVDRIADAWAAAPS